MNKKDTEQIPLTNTTSTEMQPFFFPDAQFLQHANAAVIFSFSSFSSHFYWTARQVIENCRCNLAGAQNQVKNIFY
jgi:hypothetical protein